MRRSRWPFRLRFRPDPRTLHGSTSRPSRWRSRQRRRQQRSCPHRHFRQDRLSRREQRRIYRQPRNRVPRAWRWRKPGTISNFDRKRRTATRLLRNYKELDFETMVRNEFCSAVQNITSHLKIKYLLFALCNYREWHFQYARGPRRSRSSIKQNKAVSALFFMRSNLQIKYLQNNKTWSITLMLLKLTRFWETSYSRYSY